MFIVTPDNTLQANTVEPQYNEKMRSAVLTALSELHALRDDLEDALAMEVAEIVDEYRELRKDTLITQERIPDHWFQAVGEQIVDLCAEYAYPCLLPDGWDNPDPAAW